MTISATVLNTARRLVLSGADGIRHFGSKESLEVLEAALQYARDHKGSKTCIAEIERQIRKKRKEKGI